MNPIRFDAITKALATRLSRRSALKHGGAVAAAGVLAAGAKPVVTQAQGAATPVHAVIRRYHLAGAPDAVRQALLAGYMQDICQASGFQAYFAVEAANNVLATVAVFANQQEFDAFTAGEADWIAQNLGPLLPAPAEAISGQAHVHVGNPQAFRNTCASLPPVPTAAPVTPTPAPPTPCTSQNCRCTTGTQQPCDAGLVCCPTTDRPGGPGHCQPEDVCYPHQCDANGDACAATCNWGDECAGCCSGYCGNLGSCDDPPPTPCTGQGCACSGGVQGACDGGLVCCQSGQSIPGGAGTCPTAS